MKIWKLIIFGLFIVQVGYAQKTNLDQVDFLINVKEVNSLTQAQVIQVFKNGRSLWESKEKVIIVLPANNSELAPSVASNLYGTSVSAMQKFWLALVFQGRASPPVFLQSGEEILNYVKNNPGAIAAVPRGSVQIPSNLKLTVK